MRVGVVARTNSRGLDIQTSEAARNLDASVLVVNVIGGPSRRKFPSDPSRYPGAPVVDCHPGWKLDQRIVRTWLEGVDVVYTAETFYDDRFTRWAASQKVATVVHANPEFVPPGGGWAIGTPSAWWSATSWRLGALPSQTRVVPFPVATDRFTPILPHSGPCRWLHVAGKQAMHDRNGTVTVIEALRFLREPCEVTICTQDPALPLPVNPPPHVKVNVVTGGVPDYWSLYADHDALVMPRRYGGLCLPVQEAMAAGMAVVMSDITPNFDWPIRPVRAKYGPLVQMPAGRIPIASVTAPDLAAHMDTLADPDERAGSQSVAREWACEHSWARLGARWRDDMAALSCTLPS